MRWLSSSVSLAPWRPSAWPALRRSRKRPLPALLLFVAVADDAGAILFDTIPAAMQGGPRAIILWPDRILHLREQRHRQQAISLSR
jgi:hypothetical protein